MARRRHRRRVETRRYLRPALVNGHPYRDGNKRIGFLAMVTFLGINGYEFQASDEEVVSRFVALAAVDMTERQLDDWIRRHAVKSG